MHLEDATDFDVIVVDAKLVGDAFNSGGKIEPVAPLECMHTHIPYTRTSKLKCGPPIVQFELIPPTGPELPRGSSCSVSKSSEWTTAPLNGIKAPSFVVI